MTGVPIFSSKGQKLIGRPHSMSVLGRHSCFFILEHEFYCAY